MIQCFSTRLLFQGWWIRRLNVITICSTLASTTGTPSQMNSKPKLSNRKISYTVTSRYAWFATLRIIAKTRPLSSASDLLSIIR